MEGRPPRERPPEAGVEVKHDESRVGDVERVTHAQRHAQAGDERAASGADGQLEQLAQHVHKAYHADDTDVPAGDWRLGIGDWDWGRGWERQGGDGLSRRRRGAPQRWQACTAMLRLRTAIIPIIGSKMGAPWAGSTGSRGSQLLNDCDRLSLTAHWGTISGLTHWKVEELLAMGTPPAWCTSSSTICGKQERERMVSMGAHAGKPTVAPNARDLRCGSQAPVRASPYLECPTTHHQTQAFPAVPEPG